MAQAEDSTHLDLKLFRADQGGDPDVVRKSQERRFKDVAVVDNVIALDKQWREAEFQVRELRTEVNNITKLVKEKRKAGEDTTALQAKSKEVAATIPKVEAQMVEIRAKLVKAINGIGNIVDDTVVISKDEEENGIVRTWGEPRRDAGLKNHHALMLQLQGIDTDRGTKVAGGRGYFLRGELVLLNYALVNFGLDFLYKRGYTPVQTPFFMKKDVMAQCAQLEQFDEELYHVTGEGDDKYLIATSEQPIAAMHMNEVIDPTALPIRYVGMSTCFRKEAGSHGRDTLGIFRTHQFEKIEQFVVTSPEGRISWEEHEKMIANSEEFYQALGIPYRVVNIVSGALNNAAAKKYDLEGWYPGSNNGNGVFRELVSCSNCTDYQARRLGIKWGTKKGGVDARQQFVHMLNSTLCATERLMCCIVENYQTPEGIRVPDVLKPYMHGVEFIPFKTKTEAAAPAAAPSV